MSEKKGIGIFLTEQVLLNSSPIAVAEAKEMMGDRGELARINLTEATTYLFNLGHSLEDIDTGFQLSGFNSPNTTFTIADLKDVLAQTIKGKQNV